jgi:predicted methyltransferase MtxX (methanogen marker protein 4)
MNEAMKEYLGIVPANDEEVAMYHEVEEAFDLEEDEEDYEKFVDLMHKEELDDLLKNKVKNPELKALLRKKHLTMEKACTWYFID